MSVAERDLAAELAQPKYAAFERERRWLVESKARPDVAGLGHVLIEDRYLDGSRFRLRRMSESGSAWESRKLTKKYETDTPAVRPIVTAYLTDAEYALFASLPGRDIIKRRYRVPDGARIWCLDLFEGALAGLELIECEETDDAALAAMTPPLWARREITGDLRYQCGTLAQSNCIPEE